MYKELILNSFNENERKHTFSDLKKRLKVKGEIETASFSNALKELREEGKLYLKDEIYRIFEDTLEIKQGIMHINKSSVGFVEVEGSKETYMIRKKDINGALPKDIVIIKPYQHNYYGHQLAKVEEIIKRDEFLEIFEYIGDERFKPYELDLDMEVIVNEKACKDIVPGTLVLLEVSTEKQDQEHYSGNIQKIIGHIDDPKIDELAISYKYGFDHHFSDTVMKDTYKLPTKVLQKELKGRIDLRDKQIFTIDGKDTKDIDDAIGLEKIGENYILRVCIADVAHYLMQYPSLIKEAVKRGNSAYFADSVVPMLPHKLSNGICSLNPNEDRLTLTAQIEFDKTGEIINYDVYPSIINSKKKMNYDDVNTIINENIIPEGYEPFVQTLKQMEKLSTILQTKREKKGCLKLSGLEFKIHTNKEGTPTQIKKSCHQQGEQIIENFMIAANIIVTELFGYLSQPFIYRIHDTPDLIKLQSTIEILKQQGICTGTYTEQLLNRIEKAIQKKSEINPIELQPLLKEARQKGAIEGASSIILCTMQKAEYSHKNIGHFGLAEEDYCHFTSPIRRTADLIDHIIIKLIIDIISANTDEELMEIQEKLNTIAKALPSICTHISQREIAADKAEREIEEMKMVKYFINNPEKFEGPVQAQILSSSQFGLTILIEDQIKAIINKKELEAQGYTYMRDSHTYLRHKTKDCFKIGTKIYVLDPETSVNFKTIKYNIALTNQEYQDQQEKPKTLRKKHQKTR